MPYPDYDIPSPRQIFARRAGRLTFGLVLLAGVGVLLAAECSDSLETKEVPGLDARWIIGATWLAALVAGAVTRAVTACLRPSLRPEVLFTSSLVVPTIGVALLLPITLHMLIALAIAAEPSSFHIWIELSLWITGITHVVFAALCATHVHQLIRSEVAMMPRKIYTTTLITSCVPFAVLVFPPLLVALTAAPFVPMLHAMARLIDRERAELASIPHRLPRATVVTAQRSQIRTARAAHAGAPVRDIQLAPTSPGASPPRSPERDQPVGTR